MEKRKFDTMQKLFLILAVLFVWMGIMGGIFTNVGSVLLCGFAAVLAGIVFLQRKTGRKHKMLIGFVIVVLAVLATHAVVWNYFAFCRPPVQNEDATVIVLGCKVNGEEPSLMLKRRLLKAKEYLEQNPQANCVVSGGMGENESHTEAHVMKKFLVESGISEQRVYEENRSTNTDTNIRYSLQVIQQQELGENLIICTDGFHQLRAWMYVRRNGRDAAAISGKTPFWVIPSYAVREMGGILKMLLLG